MQAIVAFVVVLSACDAGQNADVGVDAAACASAGGAVDSCVGADEIVAFKTASGDYQVRCYWWQRRGEPDACFVSDKYEIDVGGCYALSESEDGCSGAP